MRDHGSTTDSLAGALLDVAALRAETPGCAEVVHFNNAGCGLIPSPVLYPLLEHLDLEARIGGYEAAARQAEAVSDFYAAIGAVIGCAPGNVAFASSATHAFATGLSAIPFEPGDVILTTRNDFVSNQIAFLALRKRFGVRVVHAPDAPEGGVDAAAMAELMRLHRPRLVAATHIPTNSGLIQPVAEIGRHCRELDLLYLVDACQSVGQVPIDVEAIGADMLTATCRKYLRGPRGSGFLYVSDRVLQAGYEPLFIDMHGSRWVAPDRYQPVETAARFEDWEFPYAIVLGCAAAARYAENVGVQAGGERARALAKDLRAQLAAIAGVRVLERGADLGALVTFAVDGWQPQPFKAALDARGVNSALSFRDFAVFDFGDKDIEWCLRLSPHYYNTEAEVGMVASAVADLAAARGAR